MKRFCILSALTCLMGALVSCSTTPASRIQDNPAIYNSLPQEDKQLVTMGQIRTGMTQQAVFLAWGYPNAAPVQGEKDGKRFSQWIYTDYEPQYTHSVWVGGYWGYPGWYGGPYMGTTTNYVQRPVRRVSFENDVVTSWEASR